MVACPVVPPRVNSNLNNQCRESCLSAGVNLHFLAASLARRAKYQLGPGFSSIASVTLPERSTITSTATLIWPRIVRRAVRGTLGISSWTTEGEASANGGARWSERRETGRGGAGLDSLDFALAAGAAAWGGAGRGVSGLGEAAAGTPTVLEADGGGLGWV